MISSERKPGFVETDRGKEFFENVFQNFLNNDNIKHYSRKTSPSGFFAELFKKSIRNLFKKLVFEKADGNWIDVLPIKTKQNKTPGDTSTKFTLIQASFKKNEGYVYKNLLDKRKKTKPNLQVNDLVRTAD